MNEETSADRAERCLAMAAQLRAQATRAGDPEVAAGFLELAAIWLQLAEDARGAANDDVATGRSGEGEGEGEAQG